MNEQPSNEEFTRFNQLVYDALLDELGEEVAEQYRIAVTDKRTKFFKKDGDWFEFATRSNGILAVAIDSMQWITTPQDSEYWHQIYETLKVNHRQTIAPHI